MTTLDGSSGGVKDRAARWNEQVIPLLNEIVAKIEGTELRRPDLRPHLFSHVVAAHWDLSQALIRRYRERAAAGGQLASTLGETAEEYARRERKGLPS